MLATSIKQTWLWCGFLFYMNTETSIEIGSSLQLEIEDIEVEIRTKEKECPTIEEDFGGRQLRKYLKLDWYILDVTLWYVILPYPSLEINIDHHS